MSDTPSLAAGARADEAARRRALDTGASFIVQAPAGSGKTELLIQRFLALLAIVPLPESIVAMTFTRKAAGEMRERIIAALREAAQRTPVTSPHAELTRSLALAALARDEALGWRLLAHPSRLRIVTIDAIAAGLARDAPVATRAGGMPRFEEHPDALYRAAAADALADAAPDHVAWRTLLDHLDNDGERVVELLASLLARREQWLRLVVGADAAELRTRLEHSLARELTTQLATVVAAWPRDAVGPLVALAAYAQRNLEAEGAEALAAALRTLADRGELPAAQPRDLALWRSLAAWLLTGQGAWRRKIDKGLGFPAKGSGPGAAERGARKEEMQALLDVLAAAPGLEAALHEAGQLPEPRFAPAAWAVVEALLEVLPRVAAALRLRFAQRRALDFSEATFLALVALGEPDAPSDVLLALDRRIDHLLIDEFQDTSLMQHELVLRLTAGWVPGDGRTLFLVGDPMQSIYRFREAEVGLFLGAQRDGRVGALPLAALTLSRNFRSARELVGWVNAVFPAVLPAADDPLRGAVSFKPAVAHRADLPRAGVSIDVVTDKAAEAASVVQRVRDALATRPDADAVIAILVRARSHLEAILPALRDAGIPYQAVELDRLSERGAIRDLLALTHALLQPADRLAWLAVLRAPWCGLVLADLEVLVTQAGAAPLWPAITDATLCSTLSADGRARLARVAGIVGSALAERQRLPLALWLRGVWLALGGAATLEDRADLGAADRYFALLAQHASAGDLPDWSAFVTAVDALHAEPDADAGGGVQVMTIHRAKGLEFDTTIIAGLARKPARPDKPLLRWRERADGLLLAPLKGRADPAADPVYTYLERLHEEEEDAELGRLLYVGATRAKRRLHLVACLEPKLDRDHQWVWSSPPARSMLAKLLPCLGPLPPCPEPAQAAASGVTAGTRRLQRLPVDWQLPAPPVPLPVPEPLAAAAQSGVVFDWARETARLVGTVAHRALARLATTGLQDWDEARLGALRPRWRAALEAAGVEARELPAATLAVEAILVRTLADARGRWLFDAAHAEARSEWALAGLDGDDIVHVSLDRSFVTEGTRWIVDFKTGTHTGGDLEAFLDREQERYAPQLERYARFLRELDTRPIRLALYYPLHAGWREWPFPG